jgi:hypothetical protein
VKHNPAGSDTQPPKNRLRPDKQSLAAYAESTGPLFAGQARSDVVEVVLDGLVNWPRSSPETNGELSAGKRVSRIGVDISNVWFVFRQPVLRPTARQEGQPLRNGFPRQEGWPALSFL